MKAIVVLSHLMDCNGKLEDESIKRANLAIDTFRKKNNIDFILTIGWAYRKDIFIPIGLSMRKYLISKGVNEDFIKTDINSRDTVGDAVFSKINFIDIYDVDKLYIITSDYHVMRVQEIFELIMPIDIEVLGCDTSEILLSDSSEIDSLLAFRETFKHTNFKSNDSLLETLRSKHPFYNGEMHNKIQNHPMPLL